ncbi:MFS transporter, partial [Desulfosoma sp.]|uniref:MFS transporter n=1 Tax=Desulfosoma sp. TaxID=2603217 RepID=UPI00404A3D91
MLILEITSAEKLLFDTPPTILFRCNQTLRTLQGTGKVESIHSGGSTVVNEDQQKLLRYRWLIFATLALGYLFVYFHRLSLSVVAEELAVEFGTSAGSLGFLGSVYFYCYALMQFPAGLLSDSIGPRKAVSAFTVVASVGSLLFGLAPNLPTAFAGRFLVGLGAAMVFIP